MAVPPDLDSRPFLAGLLDAERGGRFTVAPVGLQARTVTWLDDALTFVPDDRRDAVADAVRTVLAAADR